MLTAALWPRGVTDEVRDATLAQAAQWLGVTATGPRVAVSSDGLWQLDRAGLRHDWDVFRALVNRAAAADDPNDDLELAMGLVSGPVWSGAPGRPRRMAGLRTDRDRRTDRRDRRRAATGRRHRRSGRSQAGQEGAAGRADRWCRPARRSGATRWDLGWSLRRIQRRPRRCGRHVRRPSRFGSPRGAQAETDALVDELLPGYRKEFRCLTRSRAACWWAGSASPAGSNASKQRHPGTRLDGGRRRLAELTSADGARARLEIPFPRSRTSRSRRSARPTSGDAGELGVVLVRRGGFAIAHLRLTPTSSPRRWGSGTCRAAPKRVAGRSSGSPGAATTRLGRHSRPRLTTPPGARSRRWRVVESGRGGR